VLFEVDEVVFLSKPAHVFRTSNIDGFDLVSMRKPSRDQSIQILGELPIGQAFYFHNGVGSPTGVFTRSLAEFIDFIKVIELGSLEFHMFRGDFEKWITMLGDETLSQQIINLRQDNLKGESLRKRLLQVLRLRYGFLRKIANAATS